MRTVSRVNVDAEWPRRCRKDGEGGWQGEMSVRLAFIAKQTKQSGVDAGRQRRRGENVRGRGEAVRIESKRSRCRAKGGGRGTARR